MRHLTFHMSCSLAVTAPSQIDKFLHGAGFIALGNANSMISSTPEVVPAIKLSSTSEVVPFLSTRFSPYITTLAVEVDRVLDGFYLWVISLKVQTSPSQSLVV